jgi:hypothetical protein
VRAGALIYCVSTTSPQLLDPAPTPLRGKISGVRFDGYRRFSKIDRRKKNRRPPMEKGSGGFCLRLQVCVLVPLAGIELATFSLRMNCSTN